MNRPLSVVVLGSSMPHLIVPARAGRHDGSYAEVLRAELAASGVPVDLHLESRWFEFAHSGLHRYEESVRAHVPDVLVINYGLNESQPWLVPVTLLRHFIHSHEATTPLRQRYRERFATPVWKKVRSYRRWASPLVRTRTWQTRPARFTATMTTIIKAARIELRPLVLVLDVAPPGPLLTHFLPGQEARHRVFQDLLESVVAGFADRDVRLVRTEPMVRELGFEAALPDGMHYSSLGHRRIGEMLAAEVRAWLGAHDADPVGAAPAVEPRGLVEASLAESDPAGDGLEPAFRHD